jgi:hypothetical protein
MSKDWRDLHPILVPIYFYLLRDCMWVQAPVVPIHTYRSPNYQDELWRQGRNHQGEITDRSRVVTFRKGGKSYHNVQRDGVPASLAFDVALQNGHGQPHWPEAEDPRWRRIGLRGEYLGLTWGGRWKMRDMGHFQLDNKKSLSIQSAMNGVDPDPPEIE